MDSNFIQVFLTSLIVVIILVAIIRFVIVFLRKSKDDKIKSIKLALLDLVIEAERLLKTKTGKAKRSKVYNWLIDKIPFLEFFISEAMFDNLLNNTLEEMRKLLAENDELYEYVYGEKRLVATLVVEGEYNPITIEEKS